MNKTKIEWADYTWNPVVGCKHGCSYCYARKIHNRFNKKQKWEEPHFYVERLSDPGKVKKPSKIFVGSMCDLFGNWMDRDIISLIINVTKTYNQHTYMFLTKNPTRYQEFEFPDNCMIGLTLTEKNLKLYRHLINTDCNRKFVSIEPIMGDFTRVDFSQCELVIVGAMTGLGAIKPEKDWIKSIKHDNIFYKNNIKEYL